MKLVTEVPVPEYPFKMDHQTPVLMMGSCFTENIGSLMVKYLFQVQVNPFGVTYNPLSVKRGLEALINKENYTEADLEQYNNLWFSFDHDTRFSAPDVEASLQKINTTFLRSKEMLGRAGFLIITWGTAWIFRNNSDGKVVCNCHKIPASRFSRSRLTVTEIVEAYDPLLKQLIEKNPALKVMVNVSPVRHWKDGPHGNQLSKSTLLLAQETLEKLYPLNVFYFPSYEIVMDELRDYRFYSSDMLHPNDQATGYIWERFQQSVISPDSQKIMGELEELLKMTGHRPRNQNLHATRQMIQKRDKKLKDLKAKYPTLAWNNKVEN